MLKLIKRGEKLEGKQVSQLKGGVGSCGTNFCLNCGNKMNDAAFEKGYLVTYVGAIE